MGFIKCVKINYCLLLTRLWFLEKCKLGVMWFVAHTMDMVWDPALKLSPLRNTVPYYVLTELGDSRSGFVCTRVLSLSSEQGWAQWPQTYLHQTQVSCLGLWQAGENQRKLQLIAWAPIWRMWFTVFIHVSHLEVVSQVCHLLGVSASPSSADLLFSVFP